MFSPLNHLQYRCVRTPENSSFQTRAHVVRVAMAQLSCSFATYCGSKCDFSSRWPGRQQLIPLNSCADNVKEHLREVKVFQTCVASEKELILARAGLFGDSDGRDFTIYPKHLAELGVRFRPSMKCQHPLHGNRRRKVERGINLKMAKEIKEKFNTVVPFCAGNFRLYFLY